MISIQPLPWFRPIGVVSAWLGLTCSALFGEDVPIRPDLVDGLSPHAAAARMRVPDGFVVQLAAGEPQLHQPIAMTIDERGRVWVAEAYNYPIRAPEGQGLDKVVVLEDTDQDGSLDKRTVFAEGLNLVSGLEVGYGGVWVGAAPYLLFFPDRDQDDVPDSEPTVVLDGFGFEDTHETLNSFQWGPDGWLYGCHGVFTHSRVGRPGTPDASRVPIDAGVWRYHPRRQEFEVFAWGTSNPWGVDFDEHGQAFVTACVIPHLYHVIQGGRYQRQAGSHFDSFVYDDLKTIADHAHFAGDVGQHAWWGRELVDIPSDTDAAGGGHAHCGCLIYQGSTWPPKYRNTILMCNIHGNRVNQDLLVPNGSGFVGRHGPDFLLSHDRWFRGINLRTGPDGSVFLIDWYDKNACHRTSPEIWDRSNGRIYNIQYGSRKPEEVDLRDLTTSELVELHRHNNSWQVRTARRLLLERQDPDAQSELRRLLEVSNPAPLRLQALWTLAALGALTDADTTALLGDQDPWIRCWAVQAALDDRTISSSTWSRLVKLAADDTSPNVQLYLAAALQRLPLEQRWDIAQGLLRHDWDPSEPNLPLMVWFGIAPLVDGDPSRALNLIAASGNTQIPQFAYRRAAGLPSGRDALVERLDGGPSEPLILREMEQALQGADRLSPPRGWDQAYLRLTREKGTEVAQFAHRLAFQFGDRRMIPAMRAQALDRNTSTDDRQQALDMLIQSEDPQVAATLLQLLDDPTFRGQALAVCARIDDPAIAAKLIHDYQDFSPEERGVAIQSLTARAPWSHRLLDAIDAGTIPRSDLHAYHVRQLLQLDDPPLRDRVHSVWGSVRESQAESAARIAALKEKLSVDTLRQADIVAGRGVWEKTCQNCHKLFGKGESVGPDLTGADRQRIDYLLENVLDPGAVLGRDYRMTMIQTTDGRVLTGLVTQETDHLISLRTLNEAVEVAKEDVEERSLMEQSMMPDNLIETLKPEEVRDLFAYLQSSVEIDVPGPPAPLNSEGNVANALEGEAFRGVEASAGSTSTQDMHPFSAAKWSGNAQLIWSGSGPDARLTMDLPVPEKGRYRLEMVFTRAVDYGIVQVVLDGGPLGPPIDLYTGHTVDTTGVRSFGPVDLTKGVHRLEFQIRGRHPLAVPSFLFGLDYVRLVADTGKSP